MKLSFLFLGTLIFMFISCSDDSSTIMDNDSGVIIPLKIGNSWTFSNGIEMRVSTDVNFNDKDAFKINYYVDTVEVGSLILTNLSDGIYFSRGGPFTIWFKYPGSKDERYGGNSEDSYWVILSN